MATLDIILLVLLGFGLFKGFMNGLILELFFFIAFFVGLFLALELTVPVTNYLLEGNDLYGAGGLLVFIVLFVLLVIGIRQLGRLIIKAVHVTLLGTLDKVLGGIFGVLKWSLLASVFFWVIDSVGIQLEQANESYVYPYVAQVGPTIFSLAGTILPVFQDLIDSLQQM